MTKYATNTYILTEKKNIKRKKERKKKTPKIQSKNRLKKQFKRKTFIKLKSNDKAHQTFLEIFSGLIK